ncbi:DUF421 domain-containing protein [Dysosmobacter sp.]|uniref:DUF421 domain-containing protein n=1 Tax=Dysosmobacter sp. TaxID=2591382 RepID=UPI002A8E41EF|nr:DUF421 domain-containing protein [Dysosmobacter sp.]MDY3282895.1 DUF421 domain-containing protein [Dysosmobacter sp.]
MTTAFFRTVILYFFIMAGLRLMGKRQIGELEPSELVLTMMLSDLAAVPMQDFGIPLLAGVVPILTLLAISMLLSQLSLHSLRLRRLLCGAPTVLIDRGRVCQAEMKRNRFTLDELLEQLRSQGYCGPEAVKYAVLENSGKLSILPWPREQPATAGQLHQVVEDDVTLPRILINDGRVLSENLRRCGRDRAWLAEQLSRRGHRSPEEIFLLTIDETGKLFLLPREEP